MYNFLKLNYKIFSEKKISYSYGGIDVLINNIFKKKILVFMLMLAVTTQSKIIILIYYLKKIGMV